MSQAEIYIVEKLYTRLGIVATTEITEVRATSLVVTVSPNGDIPDSFKLRPTGYSINYLGNNQFEVGP